MNPVHARALAMLLLGGMLVAFARALTQPLERVVLPAAMQPTVQVHIRPELDVTDSLAAEAVQSAPFRVKRAPAAQAFDARRQNGPVGAATPRPSLILTGILWGRSPAAIVEGLPGTEGGKLVRRGDIVNGVAIRSITRTTLSAAGLDTSWTLRVREVWR